jgi:hypothetical protein
LTASSSPADLFLIAAASIRGAVAQVPPMHQRRASGVICASVIGHPSRTLGSNGLQSEASRSLRFDMRSERAIVSPTDPNSEVAQLGMNRGGFTPMHSASEPK